METKEHILLARQVGVPAVVVFLNKMDQIGKGDEEFGKKFCEASRRPYNVTWL